MQNERASATTRCLISGERRLITRFIGRRFQTGSSGRETFALDAAASVRERPRERLTLHGNKIGAVGLSARPSD